MQNKSMFQSFLKKKQLIAQMVAQTKSMTNSQTFNHFEAVSEPVFIKAESNAIYLTHLNNQFKDQLREFVHEQESFNQTNFQLAKITQALETEMAQFQNQYRSIRNVLNEAELDRAILTDKNHFHLEKIISFQEQTKTLQLLGQQYQRSATELEEQIEYEKCMMSEIQSRNNEIVSNLQVKTVQIEQATSKMENSQRSIRKKESSIKRLKQEINDIYFTLQAQDDSLSGFCTAIEQGLETQNNRINDIEFVKNKLSHIVEETQLRKLELKKAEETEAMLLNYEDDMSFDLKRVSKQLQIETKGIDDEHWKIEQEGQRYQDNQAMLLELQSYLKALVQKNELLQQSLQEQIIQDHTIKRIVDSKTQQPVGRKTKLFLEQYEEKELADTSSSWKENDKPHPLPTRLSGSIMSPKHRRQLVERQVNKMVRKGPQQIDLMYEKYSKSFQSYQEKEINDWDQQGQVCLNKWEANPFMSTTGFTYIDKLSKLQTQV